MIIRVLSPPPQVELMMHQKSPVEGSDVMASLDKENRCGVTGDGATSFERASQDMERASQEMAGIGLHVLRKNRQYIGLITKR